MNTTNMNASNVTANNIAASALNLGNLRLAVLIDAENIPHRPLKKIMEEIAIYGIPTIKRIYGDWTNPLASRWKTLLLENAITPIQQYGYTAGKNSSDSAMIIDAMDILYTSKTDGFVLVSSDSDFTGLAIRLREAGQRVIGIGERKTPNAFIAACDKFTYIEVISGEQKDRDAQYTPHHRKMPRNDFSDFSSDDFAKPREIPSEIILLIADSVADLAGESGEVFMGELGNLILKKQPDFDHRNFGYKNLSSMIKSIERFDIEFRQTTDPNIKHPYVRDKEA
ncbi:MAG: NYN domain-containing protein [Oscillospiraceae bacterium]|nr:NYN domain-containing protein [Oscillospiraceae bacterium]